MSKASADSSRPRLPVADDHTIFAQALRVLLEERFSVLGIVTDGRAMVAEAAGLKPDVIVAEPDTPPNLIGDPLSESQIIIRTPGRSGADRLESRSRRLCRSLAQNS